MKTRLIAAVTALSLAAAAPAFAGENSHHWHNGGGWNGGHHHGGAWNGYRGGYWRGNNWGWGAPLLGGLAGAAIIGGAIAAPYYGYGGYGYVPYYYPYPTQLVAPATCWRQNPYGGWWFLC